MVDRFSTPVASTSDIIAAVDQSGLLTYISHAIQPTLGLAPADVIGHVLWELVHPDDIANVHAALTDLFQDGDRRSIEFQMPDVSGRWHRLDAVVALRGGDPPLEAVLTAVDVTTERESAQAGEREEQRRQAQKMEVVGRLAGGISHDFANLLTIIIGTSARVLDGLPAGSPLTPHVESIRLTAERAASMVRQLLTFSRKRDDELTVLDVNDVVRETEELLRRLLGEHVELHTQCHPDVWPVNANRTQLEQVLLNLAVNGRDAMPQGGRLTIETKNLDAAAAAVYDPSASGASVAVSVTDNGAGMDSSTQARAFEPFFTTKPAGAGTGLGLATVHGILKASGGWTHLQSTPGGGTTVTFGLPRAYAAALAAPPPAAIAKGGTETLLLVEDEEGVRELVRDMLDLAGYRVLEASRPSEAERIAREFDGTIDMLLTDVVMPEMSGLELSIALRSRRAGLPVMYMSGFPEPMVGHPAVAISGAHFLSKPFDRQTLLRAVRQALDAVAATTDRL